MIDHDDTLTASGWTDTSDDLYSEHGWLRTQDGYIHLAVAAEPQDGQVRLWMDADELQSAPLSRPQVDELIRMLVVARAEAWPVDGEDTEDDSEEDWEIL